MLNTAKKKRQFVLGQNDEVNRTIQTVPKFVSLHITRLHPSTKPEELQNMLRDKFPDVTCEPHVSKYPDKYASIKVSIRQENFKDAWNRNVWPAGSLVSRFLVKKRTWSLTDRQADPR